MDYESYQLSKRERLQCLLIGLLFTGALAWLFYRSVYGMVLLPPVCLFINLKYKKSRAQKRKEQLLAEFADAMQAVSAALLAGYSMENAWREAEYEVKKMRGESCYMYRELCQMNKVIEMNEPVEKVLAEFADRSGCEEIESFAEIFAFAKRSGGDFVKIIRTTVWKLVEKMEVEQEIAAVLAGKKLEGRIMNAMPFFILAYLNLTSGDFLEVLYGNVLGILVMSVALVGCFMAIKLSEHILDIRV